ncbi:MAG: hypothetical protein KA716_23235 [Gloeotrichia echinulata DEX184]|nr:hypothetical protein [Gloeotrichia echinulata DEX184]
MTCEAVITEACFLLQDVYKGEDAVIKLINRKTIEIPFHLSEETADIQMLMTRYSVSRPSEVHR